jgi:hypothetical protein
MNPKRSTSHRYVAYLLLLAGVLVLGIIQWSFLPLLIQNGPVASGAHLEMSASHSSKFAAPFKCLTGDGLRPCLVRSRTTFRRTVSRIVHLPDAVISGNKQGCFPAMIPVEQSVGPVLFPKWGHTFVPE